MAVGNGVNEWLREKRLIIKQEYRYENAGSRDYKVVDQTRLDKRLRELAVKVINKYPEGLGHIDCVGRGTPRYFLNELEKKN